jgi:hypothetical protein
MGKEYRLDIVYNDNGEEMPRWVKYRKDKQKLDKLEKKQGGGFSQRFDAILAKHDGRKRKFDENNVDFKMGDRQTKGENRSDHRSKRKREDDDENTIMQSMKHMRVACGRRR